MCGWEWWERKRDILSCRGVTVACLSLSMICVNQHQLRIHWWGIWLRVHFAHDGKSDSGTDWNVFETRLLIETEFFSTELIISDFEDESEKLGLQKILSFKSLLNGVLSAVWRFQDFSFRTLLYQFSSTERRATWRDCTDSLLMESDDGGQWRGNSMTPRYREALILLLCSSDHWVWLMVMKIHFNSLECIVSQFCSLWCNKLHFHLTSESTRLTSREFCWDDDDNNLDSFDC